MMHEHAAQLAEQLSNHKRLATGVPTADFPSAKVSDADAGFQTIAISVGDWYLTQLHSDVNVIRVHATPQEKSALSRFYRLLKDQRDYSAHPSAYNRSSEAEAWREGVRREQPHPSPDGPLAVALLEELCAALECLCAVAVRIARSPTDSQAWQQVAAASPEEEVRAAFANIGRNLPANRIKYAVLQFSKHPELGRARSPQERANVAELVALGILAAPLRIRYDELLDEFDLVGDAGALGLLLLAHGVQASGVREARLVPVLREVWQAVQGTDQSSQGATY